MKKIRYNLIEYRSSEKPEVKKGIINKKEIHHMCLKAIPVKNGKVWIFEVYTSDSDKLLVYSSKYQEIVCKIHDAFLGGKDTVITGIGEVLHENKP